MTQVRKYRIGTYAKDKNGVYQYKNHNRTYRGKDTKFIYNEKRKEVRKAFALIILFFISSATVAFIETTNRIDIAVADGAAVGDVTVTAVASETDYDGITFMEITTEEVAKEMSVEDQIRAIAAEKNFKWADYLVRLAMCESGLNPNNKNSKGNTPAGSLDRGLFQINSYWHKEVSDACAYDVRCSTEWTIQMIENGRQGQWACNKIVLSN